MPTLQDRFADLAEDAPTSPTPSGIWADGRRRVRVRRVGTAAVVAATVAALGALGGVAARLSATPQYAGQSGTSGALPAQIHHPSPWLSGTSGRPPGQLSMLIPGKRGGIWRYHWGIVGVSATTGAYHYLDIPGCLQSDDLSPDGRHVSCFVGGSSGGRELLRGVEVYDTVTGHLDRWTPPQGRLHLDSIAWVGDGALSLRAGTTSYLWRFGHGAPTPIQPSLGPTVGSGPRSGLYAARQGYFYLEPEGAHRVVQVRLTKSTLDPARTSASVSPSGGQLALVHTDDSGGQLLVGDVSPSGARTSVVQVAASLQWPRVIGWADEQHVLVVDQVIPVGGDGSGDPGSRYALERVDVDTGTVVRVSNLMTQQDSWGASFASSLLGVPPRDFPAPPSPLNRRVEAWLALGVLLLSACCLALWRRRVRV